MGELIVPPIIIIVILAVLIVLLTRAVKQASESQDVPEPLQVPQKKSGKYSRVFSPIKNSLAGKIGSVKDKTKRLAQKRRVTAAVEEARTNRVQEEVQEDEFLEQEEYASQKQRMSPMGEIILNYRRDIDEPQSYLDQESTVATLIQSVEENPQDPDAYERLGDHFMEYQNFEDARECYTYILRLDPRHRRAQEAMKNLDRLLN